MNMNLRTWAMEVRAPFLVLPIILSLLGTSLAVWGGVFSFTPFLLFTGILVLLHVTVNTLNEYHDHLTGIDHRTLRTPYSGGSGVLQSGSIRPVDVKRVAYTSLILACVLSAFLYSVSGPGVLPIVIPGVVFAVFYTTFFARNLMGEVSAGLGLGFLPVIGAYFVQTGSLSFPVILIASASALLTFNLQLLNEFPDIDADRYGGRRNIVMLLGEESAARLYVIVDALVLGTVLMMIYTGGLPFIAIIGLVMVPLAYKASSEVMRIGDGTPLSVEGQSANIRFILGIQLIIAVAISINALGWIVWP